jgi:hypothetical protein
MKIEEKSICCCGLSKKERERRLSSNNLARNSIIMEGKKFLNVAQRMLQIRSEEAVRSAFSRIYYAVFNTGAKLLNELGFVLPKDGTAPERLYQRLNNSGISVTEEIAAWLGDLRQRRTRADYDMDSREFQSHKSCEFYFARATLVIAQLEGCYQQPLRNQLKDGIQEYERKIGCNS